MGFSEHAFLRLELVFEGVRAQVGHMLNVQKEELQAIVDDEIAHMKSQTEQLLREQVRQAIQGAIRGAMENQRFRIQRLIEPEIEKALSGLVRSSDLDIQP